MVRFAARVHPRSSRNEVRVETTGEVHIWTTAPPAGGRANDAVRRLVAEWLSAPVADVRIVAGAASRTKILDVAGVRALPDR